MLGIVYLPTPAPGAPDPARERVAGLTPLRRLVLTLQVAGCTRLLVVSRAPLDELAAALRGIAGVELVPGAQAELARLLVDTELSSQPILLADGRICLSRNIPSGLAQAAGEGSAVALDDQEAASGIAWMRAAASAALAQHLQAAPGRALAEAFRELIERGLAIPCRSAFPEFAALVVDRAGLSIATRKLFRSIYKPTDNLYARLNRRLSLPLTRLLLPTATTANLMTLLTLGVGVAAGLLMARGDYFGLALGAFLSYLAAVLDGCDGEIARLKFEESALGCWLDSVADYAYYFFFYGGLVIGLYRQTHAPWVLLAGASTISGLVAGQAITAWQRRRYSGSNPGGFAAMVQEQLDKRSDQDRSAFILKWVNQYAKRSTMPFWSFVVILLGGAKFLLWLSAICAWWYVLGALFVRRFYPKSGSVAQARPLPPALPEAAPGATSRRPVAP